MREKRTMAISITGETTLREALRRLAFKHGTTVADLVRSAVNEQYGKELNTIMSEVAKEARRA